MCVITNYRSVHMIILDLGFVSATSVCDFYNKLFYKVKTESFIITNCFR